MRFADLPSLQECKRYNELRGYNHQFFLMNSDQFETALPNEEKM